MTFSARPLNSSGGWWSSYKDFSLYASQLRDEFASQVRRIEMEEEELKARFPSTGLPEDMLHGWMLDATAPHHDLAYRTAISCHIFCCMAVEGFLNMYGVRRLGEDFFKQYVERLGIVEKVAVIGASSQQWDIQDHASLPKDLRMLFDSRNKLVHPKTVEFRADRIQQHLYRHPRDIPLSENYAAYQRCIDFFRSIDSDVKHLGLLSGI